IDLSRQRARQASAADIEAFDHIIAMDYANHADLARLADARHRRKIRLLLESCPDLGLDEVPDPYYGDAAGFDRALDLIEHASAALLDHILATHQR
ncbi:MAG: low molecular weight phosphotyrosine protein phosphatase, partial [bacterium]